MHNFVLSPIDPEKLINSISERVTANILKAVRNDQQPTTNEPPEQFLSVHEAAELLNLSMPTIYSKVNRRELPFMKRGKRLYFSRAELMDYVKTGRVMTNRELDSLETIKKGVAI